MRFLYILVSLGVGANLRGLQFEAVTVLQPDSIRINEIVDAFSKLPELNSSMLPELVDLNRSPVVAYGSLVSHPVVAYAGIRTPHTEPPTRRIAPGSGKQIFLFGGSNRLEMRAPVHSSQQSLR